MLVVLSFVNHRKKAMVKHPNSNSLYFKSNIQKIVSSLMILNADAFSRKAIKIVNEESEVAFEALL